MRLETGRASRRLGIGLTPLIDVVFILLLFFMLASSLTRLHAVPLVTGLGKTDASVQSPETHQTLLLRIRPDGALELAGNALPDHELTAALSRYRAEQAEPKLVVEPDDAVGLQRLLTVLDAVADAGLSVLRLQ